MRMSWNAGNGVFLCGGNRHGMAVSESQQGSQEEVIFILSEANGVVRILHTSAISPM